MTAGQGFGTRLECLVLLQSGVYRTNTHVSVDDWHMHIYSKCFRIYLQPEYSTIA